MNDMCWLIMDSKGIRRMAKGRHTNWSDVKRPSLGQGEYAILVDVTVPDAVFKPRASPTAKIEVPEEAVIEAPIAVEVLDPPTEEQ